MACCVLTAYVMNRLIKACELLDLDIIKIQYNQFDDGPAYNKSLGNNEQAANIVAIKVSIEGMTCAACTSAIEDALTKLKGVQRVSVSLPLAKATVVHNATTTSVEEIVKAIEGVGYGARLGQRTAQQNLELAQHSKELSKLRSAFNNAATMSSIIVTLDWLTRFATLFSYHFKLRLLSSALGIWVQSAEAWWIHERAWGLGLNSPLTMDTLISLSLLCGLALSFFNAYLFGILEANQYFSSGSFLTLVVIGGRYLDTLFRRQTSSSLADLHRLQLQMAMVRLRWRKDECGSEPGNAVQYVPCVILQPRDEIFIDPGSIIPCDCYVLEGASIVDQSTMTGESLPATKKSGDFLMSGTRNLSNELVAIVAREQGESSLEKLVSSISSATERSNDEGEGASRLLSSHFVSIVLLMALLGFYWTYTSCGESLPVSTKLNLACERAMAVLASACPCALGLATPSAVMTGLSAAWARGVILTRGLRTLQNIASLTHVVMDKTGTLTTGQLAVVGSSEHLDSKALMLLCAAERDDALTHPVARAVFRWALSGLPDSLKRDQNIIEVRDLVSEPGKGVSCETKLPSAEVWESVLIGTCSFLEAQGVSFPPGFSTCENSHQVATTVYVAINGAYTTTLFLRDTVRPEARDVIHSLSTNFNLNLTLLTGDNTHEANRVSHELNIPVLASRTLPTEKKSLVENLKSETSGNVVAMLGDGINDTPAMAAADTGIFLSPGLLSHLPLATQSSGLQRETADVILTAPSLKVLPELLLIAQKTVRQAKLNTRWAIAYNVVAVALAMGVGERWGVKLDAAMAGTMMALSSCVVMVGCVLLRWELGKVNFDGQVGEKGAKTRP